MTASGSDVQHDISLLDYLEQRVHGAIAFRHRVKQAATRALTDQGFVEVDTPLVGPPLAEYENPNLTVPLPDGRTLYLSQSPQLYKELLIQAGVERYFGFAQCFRWEAYEPGRRDQLRSFVQLDLEMVAESADEVQAVIEEVVGAVCADLGLSHNRPFPSLDAVVSMEQYGSDRPVLQGDENAHFNWVVDFPMLLGPPDDEVAPRHVFARPQADVHSLTDKQQLRDVRAHSFDLVLNGIEIGGGNMRLHDADELAHMIDLMGYDRGQYEIVLEALRRRAIPHGGFAFGFDRLVMTLAGAADIYDVIAFPDPLASERS